MGSVVHWVALVVAGLFETFWAYQLKASEGFSRPLPSVLFVVGLVASMALLGFAMRELPMAVSYAVWVGIGVLGTAVVSFATGEAAVSLPSIAFLVLLLVGVAGLSYTTH